MSAEADVERLQRLLADAEKRAESLAWQVCSSGPGLYKSAPSLALQILCLDTMHMHAVEFVCTDAIGSKTQPSDSLLGQPCMQPVHLLNRAS